MNATIIPVEVTGNPGRRVTRTQVEIEECPLAELGKAYPEATRICETDLEEFVRKNLESIFPDETLLIVGQQVRAESGKRSDLIAVDGSGNIVAIELKRDAKDAAGRSEALEFQTIRYAANCSLMTLPNVEELFARYIEKHADEFGKQPDAAIGMAREKLHLFLEANSNKTEQFNQKQRIVLVAASFDPEILSACAWLHKNRIDITCITVSPFTHGKQAFLAIERILPPPHLDDFNVGVEDHSYDESKTSKITRAGGRESLPRMPKLFEWGVIKKGDEIYIKSRQDEAAEIIDENTVRYKGEELTYNDWGKKVTGWSVIGIYEWAVLKSSGKSLDQLRREKMKQMETAVASQV